MSKTTAGVMDAPEKKAIKPKKTPVKKTSDRRGTRNKEVCTSKKSPSRGKTLAMRGEEAAAQYLVKRGYEVIERDWECHAGTADIIARDGDTLVFAEVKTRTDLLSGFPSEAITKEKRQRYEKIACAYAADHKVSDVMMRFDVLALVVLDEERLIVRHHINAFCAGEVS